MASPKYHYYVMVFTSTGPKYVTSVNRSDKTCEWNFSEKPYEFNKVMAYELCMGLCANFFNAIVVPSAWIIDQHPYNYAMYDIEWKKK